MSVSRENNNQKSDIGPADPEFKHVPLRQYLHEALQNPTLSMEPIPPTIDLGEFGREAERLVDLSLKDPEKVEYGTVVCIDKEGRMLLPRQPVSGTRTRVGEPILRDKRRVLNIHTHGDVDAPFSVPDDFEDLFFSSTSGGRPAVLVATPKLKLLMCRTKDTPLLSKSSPEKNVEELFGTIKKYEISNWWTEDSHPDSFTPALMYALTRLASELRLKIYSCAITENIARPVS